MMCWYEVGFMTSDVQRMRDVHLPAGMVWCCSSIGSTVIVVIAFIVIISSSSSLIVLRICG